MAKNDMSKKSIGTVTIDIDTLKETRDKISKGLGHICVLERFLNSSGEDETPLIDLNVISSLAEVAFNAQMATDQALELISRMLEEDKNALSTEVLQ